jgi:hypothetical protein
MGANRTSKILNLKRILSVLTLLGFFSLSTARAEYRVFLLKISKTSTEPNTNSTAAPNAPAESISFESTLDPEQYRGYYPLAANETITYTDTWRCRGRTDNRPHCPNPRAPAAAAEDAP